MNVVEIEDLQVSITSRYGLVEAVRGVSLSIAQGEILGLVGESGCGKSMTAMSVARLLPDEARMSARRLEVKGVDLLSATEKGLRAVRRHDVGVVFQSPMKALNPRLTIGAQVREAMLPDERKPMTSFYSKALELLTTVGINRPTERLRQFPHELSGGLAQRVVIAMALARRPSLLIADEPTTALDVSVQAQILDLLDQLRAELNLAVLLVSHDLDVIRDRADRVAVMYAGRIIERGRTDLLIDQPHHPYTAALVSAMPSISRQRRERLASLEGAPPVLIDPPAGCAFRFRCANRGAECEQADPGLSQQGDGRLLACWHSNEESSARGIELVKVRSVKEPRETGIRSSTPILEAVSVSKNFPVPGVRLPGQPRRWNTAVANVSLSVGDGDSLGIVGETGSGKTTLARMLIGLERPDTGQVYFDGSATDKLDSAARRAWHRDVQFVFQDASSSLDPRMPVAASIEEPLRSRGASRVDRRRTVERLLREVGLDESYADRRPRQLSGGQRQRVGIARALTVDPRLIVADEPVSALDVSVQATILNLLNRLREERGIGYVIVSHDLGVINYVCKRVAVMYKGEIVEQGLVDDVLSEPRHSYTQRLRAAVPGARRKSPSVPAGEFPQIRAGR